VRFSSKKKPIKNEVFVSYASRVVNIFLVLSKLPTCLEKGTKVDFLSLAMVIDFRVERLVPPRALPETRTSGFPEYCYSCIRFAKGSLGSSSFIITLSNL
jgi:hypothetical protein